MEPLLRLIKPLFLPLLKLDPRPPHLPEGSSLVRELKPSDAWLSFRYVATLFGLLNQVIGVGVLAFALVAKFEAVGVGLSVALAVLELIIVGLALVVTRVDWELRHYLVGDRSLRVSSGAVTRREVTVSYANVQNLEVTQGPLERLFGFKTLTLSTAGADAGAGKGENLHVVALAGLENADEVRELMLGMMKHHKDSGLGESSHAEDEQRSAGWSTARLTEVRDAAKALQQAAATWRP